MVSSGCFLDFDQFHTQNGAITDAGDATGDATSGPDGGSADADTDAGTDASGSTGAIGAACTADGDCADGSTCVQGYCTSGCDADTPCPDGSSCEMWAGQMQCVADCDAAKSCDGVAGRDDLQCVAVADKIDLGARPHQSWACLPDSDKDSIPDGEDNCPDKPNPMQRDRDGDGQGDACDSDPLCHANADSGVLDYGTVTYPATKFALPETTTLDWVPVLGGLNDDGTPADTLAIIDRAAGTWSQPTTLPYAAFDRAVGPSTGDRYLVTPGTLQAGQSEMGEQVVVGRDGTTTLDAEYTGGLYDKVIATTGDDYTLVFGYGHDASSSSNDWRLLRYNPATHQYEGVTGGMAYDRVAWHAAVTMQGEVIFYSQVMPTLGAMRLLRVSADARSASITTVQLPAREPPATGQFDPFIVSGTGGVLYAFDRAVGSAVRIDLQSGSVTRINEFDLNLAANDPHFVSVPGSPSFLVVDRSTDDPTKLSAKEYFLPCLPGTDARDGDGDGVGDILDNCPSTANPDQKDADFDFIGDSCDADADNDGTPNDSDKTLADDGATEVSLALDTDNDGTPNESDDDIDNDGIPNSADRMPVDTDNDGLNNAVDTDDDSDGYKDSDEAAAGTDPLDPLSFPGAGVVSWVRDDGSTRSVQYAPVDDAANATTLAGDTSTAYQPRFVDGGQQIFALDGQPGTATGVELISTDPNATAPAQTFDVGVALRGAAPAPGGLSAGVLSSIVAAHANQQTTGAWQLSMINVGDATVTPLVTMFGDVSSPSVAGGIAAFLAAPAGCDACRRAYTVSVTDGTLSAATTGVKNPTNLRYDGSTLVMVGEASKGDGTSAYVVHGTSVGEFRPPGTTQVDSAVRTASGQLLVAARADDQSHFGVWLYNPRSRRWYAVASGADDLVDIDWVAQVPEPATAPPVTP